MSIHAGTQSVSSRMQAVGVACGLSRGWALHLDSCHFFDCMLSQEALPDPAPPPLFPLKACPGVNTEPAGQHMWCLAELQNH